MTLAVRPMRGPDVGAVVDVHLRSFPGFFLSFLGPSFLRQLYHGIVADPTGVAFVVEEGGRITGFVAGTTEPGGFYGRLLRQRLLRFALASVWPFLRRPAILPRLLRALRRPAESSACPSGSALLMSIAVAPESQTGGRGAMLVRAFLDETRSKGAKRIVLTTDAAGNDAVNQFYLRQRFTLNRTFQTPEGRAMNEYELLVD